MDFYFVLTFEYADKSAFKSPFRICGITQSGVAACAWRAGGEQNKVYKMPLDQIKDWSSGYEIFE